MMRTKLFFLLLLMLLQMGKSVHAMDLSQKRYIALRVNNGLSYRSIPIFPSVFIEESLLSIEFPAGVSSAAITVKNGETNEVIYYSEECKLDSLNIDLSDEDAGKYILEIEFPTIDFIGGFELCSSD